MSTTRHLINRQRRLATAPVRGPEQKPRRKPDPEPRRNPEQKPGRERPAGRQRPGAARARLRWPAALGVLAVLLGTFAILAGTRAASVNGGAAMDNDALTDTARTSEVKGAVTTAVGGIFSYSHADPGRTGEAADTHLTGRAVGQHREMLADVRRQGPAQKLVLTTTVTDSGVELLDGDRAQVLVYADQSNTRTAGDGETTYAAAMFVVGMVERDGDWKISSIDTFG